MKATRTSHVPLGPAERRQPDLSVWKRPVCAGKMWASQGFVCEGMKVQKEGKKGLEKLGSRERRLQETSMKQRNAQRRKMAG